MKASTSPPVFANATALSKILGMRYSYFLRVLNRLAKDGEISKIDKRYNLKEVLEYFYTGALPTVDQFLQQGILTLKEAHEIVHSSYAPMHQRTFERKVRQGLIPSIQIGSTYRISKTVLLDIIEDGKIPYRPIKTSRKQR